MNRARKVSRMYTETCRPQRDVAPPRPRHVEPEPTPEPDYSAMTRAELREQAKQRGLKGWGRMLKDQLVVALSKVTT